MKRIALLSIFVALSMLPMSASARRSTPLHVTTASHGAALTLWVSRSAYPWNGLAQVTVSIRNASRHDLQLARYCLTANPWVQVATVRGVVVYPPALQPLMQPACLVSSTLALRPGHALTRHLYVIVRASRVRAVSVLRMPRASVALATPFYVLHPFTGYKPRLILHTQPTVSAEVQPPTRHVTGHLVYTETYECPGPHGKGPVPGTIPGWRTAKGMRLAPPCAHPLVWDAIAGWPGQRVVTVHYASH